MNKSPIYRIPLKITSYICVQCGKGHKQGSRKFTEHYAVNARHYGWPPKP